MGRPSLADDRIEQILDAVTRCVAQYGWDGTTLEQISRTAGLSRGHIRHYAGNRDELMDRFMARVLGRYVSAMSAIVERERPGRKTDHLVRFLLGPEFGPTEDSAAIDVLLATAARDPQLRAHLRREFLAMEREIASALRQDFPGMSAERYARTAYALFCIAFAHSSMGELSFPASRSRAARQAAADLIALLQNAGAGRPSAPRA